MQNDIETIMNSLSKSNFRSRFHLKEKDKEYVKEKGRLINKYLLDL